MEKKNVGKKKTIYIILTVFVVFAAVICAFTLPIKLSSTPRRQAILKSR